jgi:MipA family protein
MTTICQWGLATLVFFFSLSAFADETKKPAEDFQPLYELGIAGGAGELPDYPGSNQKRIRYIALPYFIYRGKVFRSDQKEGMRARFIQNEDIDLDMSAAGSFPASSADNDARRGMPDLDWLVELGPRLEIMLSRLGGQGRFRFLLPARAVFSTNFVTIIHRGLTYTPALALDFNNFPKENWRTYFKLQASFIDEKLARYFYEVEPQFATSDRPATPAQGGYLETDFMIGVIVPFTKQFRAYGGFWMNTMQGSTNQGSPLMKRTSDSTWLVGFTYLFHESTEAGHL